MSFTASVGQAPRSGIAAAPYFTAREEMALHMSHLASQCQDMWFKRRQATARLQPAGGERLLMGYFPGRPRGAKRCYRTSGVPNERRHGGCPWPRRKCTVARTRPRHSGDLMPGTRGTVRMASTGAAGAGEQRYNPMAAVCPLIQSQRGPGLLVLTPQLQARRKGVQALSARLGLACLALEVLPPPGRARNATAHFGTQGAGKVPPRAAGAQRPTAPTASVHKHERHAHAAPATAGVHTKVRSTNTQPSLYGSPPPPPSPTLPSAEASDQLKGDGHGLVSSSLPQSAYRS